MALSSLKWSVEYYEEHFDECNSILRSLDNFDKIPLLDPVSLQTIKDGTLVRYRGMIQDMLNPELYYNFAVINRQKNKVSVKSGKFRDVASCQDDEELNFWMNEFVPGQRCLNFCIPIPGTNDWVEDLQRTENSNEQHERCSSLLKRSADVMEAEADTEMDTETTASTSQNNTKRNRSSTNEQNTDLQNDVYDTSKYFPIFSKNKNNMPCIIKVYEQDDQGRTEYSLNDCVEIIGFVSLNPALEANPQEIDNDSEERAHRPPPSLVPRIHAIYMKKLVHCNPLLKQVIYSGDVEQFADNARSDLHLVLTQLLFDDALAADYMICNMISKIYSRKDNDSIGKFSINFYNIFLQNFAEEFYNILKLFMTNSHYIPLSIESLNEKSFTPRKDYELNRLISGVLQLPEGVHLILDETKMSEGKLNNTGCLNVSAIQKLIYNQELDYDFGFYPVRFYTDFPIVIISEGKSLFETDIRFKIKSELCTEAHFNESLQAVRLYLNDEILKNIRIYLTAVRVQDFVLSEEMIRKIGEDYVSMRQQDSTINSSDLHTLLVLSRFLALSRGHTHLLPEDWSRAVEMEAERKLRLR